MRLPEGDNRPVWDGRRGHYEVWYLTLTDPATGAAFWIRYTLEAPTQASEPAYARLWFTSFDPAVETGGVARYQDVPIDDYASSVGNFQITMGEATLGHGHAEGSIGDDIRWALKWDPGPTNHRHLPPIAYRVPITSTTVLAPAPATHFSGTIECGGARYELQGAPGCQTHLWGRKHAETWAWARTSAWDGGEDAFFEGIAGRVKRFGRVLPPLTVVSLRLDGRTHHLRALLQARRTASDWSTGRWTFDARGATTRLEGEVTHPVEDLVQAHYHDPDGEDSYCHNSERSTMGVRLWTRPHRAAKWRRQAALVATNLAHAEWGDRSPNPNVLRHIHPA